MQQTAVVIANGASLSGAVDLQGYILTGIVMPAAWTAASLTFAGAPSNEQSGEAGTFVPIYDDAGTEYTVSADTSRVLQIDPVKLAGVRWLKVRSGTSGTPVNQDAARTLYLILRND